MRITPISIVISILDNVLVRTLTHLVIRAHELFATVSGVDLKATKCQQELEGVLALAELDTHVFIHLIGEVFQCLEEFGESKLLLLSFLLLKNCLYADRTNNEWLLLLIRSHLAPQMVLKRSASE